MKLKKRKPWKPTDPKPGPDFIRIAELEHAAAFALEELVDMLDPRDCLHQPNEINALGILAAYVDARPEEPCPFWWEAEQTGLEHHIKTARVLLEQIRAAVVTPAPDTVARTDAP